MRRVTFTVFVFLAACGGTDMVKTTQSRQANSDPSRQAFVLTQAGQEVIASFAGSASEAAIDTCVSAWVQGDEPGSNPSEGPISKPDRPDVSGLREFLAECLGVPAPAGARALPDEADARKSSVRGQ